MELEFIGKLVTFFFLSVEAYVIIQTVKHFFEYKKHVNGARRVKNSIIVVDGKSCTDDIIHYRLTDAMIHKMHAEIMFILSIFVIPASYMSTVLILLRIYGKW